MLTEVLSVMFIRIRDFQTERIPGHTVVSYTGCINFVNKGTFKKKTLEIVQGKPNSQSGGKVAPIEEPRKVIVRVICNYPIVVQT